MKTAHLATLMNIGVFQAEGRSKKIRKFQLTDLFVSEQVDNYTNFKLPIKESNKTYKDNCK